MRSTSKTLLALGFAAATFTSFAQAASWQDKLSGAASDLMNNSNSQSTTQGTATSNSAANGGLSLATITQLLGGSNKAISSENMSNVTGVLQYCAKNNIVDNNVTSVTDKLKDKLGLTNTTAQQQQSGYLEGLQGLLNTGSNQTIDLKTLSDTQLGQKLKTKACDVVLDQGKKYLGM